MKKTFLLILAFPVLLINLSCSKSIKSLGKECRDGNQESCKALYLIATTNKDSKKSVSAVKEISDQKILVEIAKNERLYGGVREAAIDKISDQRVLLEIGKRERANYAGQTDFITSIIWAVGKNIDNQELLAEFLLNEQNEGLWRDLFKKITDQTILAKLFVVENENLQSHILRRITDRTVREKLSVLSGRYLGKGFYSAAKKRFSIRQLDSGQAERFYRFDFINKMSDADPILMIAFHKNVIESWQFLRRMKLSAQDPLLQKYMPGLTCQGKISGLYENYSGGRVAYGEWIDIKLIRSGKTVAEREWSTKFPENLFMAKDDRFTYLTPWFAEENLFGKLFEHERFSMPVLQDIANNAKEPMVIDAAKKCLGKRP